MLCPEISCLPNRVSDMAEVTDDRDVVGKKGKLAILTAEIIRVSKVCTTSFERPVNYLCDAWHVFPQKYEAWTHFNRP